MHIGYHSLVKATAGLTLRDLQVDRHDVGLSFELPPARYFVLHDTKVLHFKIPRSALGQTNSYRVQLTSAIFPKAAACLRLTPPESSSYLPLREVLLFDPK